MLLPFILFMNRESTGGILEEGMVEQELRDFMRKWVQAEDSE
jgi:hypothetical protein